MMTFVHRICTVIAAMNIIINTHIHACISRSHFSPLLSKRKKFVFLFLLLLVLLFSIQTTHFVMTSICFRVVVFFSRIVWAKHEKHEIENHKRHKRTITITKTTQQNRKNPKKLVCSWEL